MLFWIRSVLISQSTFHWFLSAGNKSRNVFVNSTVFFASRFFQVVEYETMRKDVNRSAYTRRILEIVGNIKKQKEEINKVFPATLVLVELLSPWNSLVLSFLVLFFHVLSLDQCPSCYLDAVTRYPKFASFLARY